MEENKTLLTTAEVPYNLIYESVYEFTRSFICKCECIEGEKKGKILGELRRLRKEAQTRGIYDLDEQPILLDVKEFDERVMSGTFDRWVKENHKLTELWKSVAIENSKINSKPEATANNVVSEFKKQFNL